MWKKLNLAAQIPQRTNLYLKTEVYLMFMSLFPILEAEIGCKDKATFSNFQIFLKNFQTFFSKRTVSDCFTTEAEIGCKGKVSFCNFQIFLELFLIFFLRTNFRLLPFRSESGCKGKASFCNFQIFLKKSLIKIFKNHFLRSSRVSDLIAGAK